MKTVIRTAETHPLTWRLRDDKQPVWLDEYQSKNGYAGARKALGGMAPEYPEFPGSETVDMILVHEGILDGAYDHMAEGDFYMLGGIEQAVAKYEQRKLQEEK